MVPKVLYNSGAIRKCIHALFDKPSRSDRRVILVAYIGQDHAKYLPDPHGIEIVCSPTAVATSVRAVTQLQKAGALIKFSDKLHMKVYWSAKRGCLITSANLSTNALGVKGLKEVGVFIDANAVNINELLKAAKPYAVTDPGLKRLKEQEARIKRAMARVGRREPQSGFGYLDWHKEKPVARTEWKLGYHEGTGDAAEAAKQLVKAQYGRFMPDDYIGVTKSQVRGGDDGDWLILYKLGSGTVIKIVGDLRWMFVDHVVPMSKGEPDYDKDHPFQAIQALPDTQYDYPPFPLTPAFTRAFKAAVAKIGTAGEKGKKSLIPSQRLLNEIYRRMS